MKDLGEGYLKRRSKGKFMKGKNYLKDNCSRRVKKLRMRIQMEIKV
jgi:hypothetical protein